jgi:hypothetical protein
MIETDGWIVKIRTKYKYHLWSLPKSNISSSFRSTPLLVIRMTV